MWMWIWSFVVGSAAAEEIAGANRRLEWRRGPRIERGFGRPLAVVVAVEKYGGLARERSAGRVPRRLGVDAA